MADVNPGEEDTPQVEMNNQQPDQTDQDQQQTPLTEKSEKAKIFSNRYLVGAIILVVLLFGVVGYFIFQSYQKRVNIDEEVQPPVQFTLEQGKLIIGTDATYPPMEFFDTNGNVVGYDIDLGNRIAGELNLEAEFINIAWDDVFTKLVDGEIDMIISSVTITDERKMKYDFSVPYLNAGQVIITRKEESTISSTGGLIGKKIAVQKGTTNEQQANNFTSPDLVLTYDNFIGATEALLTGSADVIFSDLTGAKGIVDANPGLKIASDPFTSEFYGVVVRKQNDELLKQINTVLDTLRQQGVLVFLKQKWL